MLILGIESSCDETSAALVADGKVVLSNVIATQLDLLKKFGGVVHAQFANPRRLLAKHVLYRMVDHLRWPGRESVGALNVKYDQALDERGIKYSDVPTDWLDKYALYIENYYDPEGEPWQESEVRRLLKTHGRGKFTGLDLKGF